MAAHVLLDGVGALGASESINVTNGQAAIQCTWIDGTDVTAITLVLQGSLDGAAWFDIVTYVASAAEITANGFMFHVVNKIARNVRVNITTLTDAGTPAVTVLYDDTTTELRQ